MNSCGSNPISVLVADDSAFMRTALTRMIDSDPDLRVVATANNGLEAVAAVAACDPDVITLDIEMPRLDGLSALRQIMRDRPRPVLMVSSLTQEGAEATLDAFELGAFDCLAKQQSYATLSITGLRDELIAKIKAAHASRRRSPHSLHLVRHPAARALSAAHTTPVRIVAVGTSTGGPRALKELLMPLPRELPVGIVIVQHMPPGFTGPLAARLDSMCRIRVMEAADGMTVAPGVALIAPAGVHMRVERTKPGLCVTRLSNEPAGQRHTPSVDVLMHSVVDVFGPSALAVIMTGMGNDGASGVGEIFRRGGYTIGQDEASCAVYGMPRACSEAAVLSAELPLHEIADQIVALCAPRVPRTIPSTGAVSHDPSN